MLIRSIDLLSNDKRKLSAKSTLWLPIRQLARMTIWQPRHVSLYRRIGNPELSSYFIEQLPIRQIAVLRKWSPPAVFHLPVANSKKVLDGPIGVREPSGKFIVRLPVRSIALLTINKLYHCPYWENGLIISIHLRNVFVLFNDVNQALHNIYVIGHILGLNL